jgi:hypothetical protein
VFLIRLPQKCHFPRKPMSHSGKKMSHSYNFCIIYPEKELRKYFDESVGLLAEANGLSVEACYAQLAKMYDGYHFCEDSAGMYNPFSLLNTLDSLKFKEYWFETGTPSFLATYLLQGNYDLSALSSDKFVMDLRRGDTDSFMQRPAGG